MDNTIKEKLAKVYELVLRGEQGEKENATQLLNKLLEKYNLPKEYIKELRLQEYNFKYHSILDLLLLQRLLKFLFEEKNYQMEKYTHLRKDIFLKMEYIDYIQLDCTYSYYKEHMKKEWNNHAMPILKRCRSNKTKTAKRKELQEMFFNLYVIRSGLYKPKDLSKGYKMTSSEQKSYLQLYNVEGGEYHQQVTTGLYLE